MLFLVVKLLTGSTVVLCLQVYAGGREVKTTSLCQAANFDVQQTVSAKSGPKVQCLQQLAKAPAYLLHCGRDLNTDRHAVVCGTCRHNY